MKIKVIHPPFNHSASDLIGNSFIIKFKGTGEVLMGKLTFSPDSTEGPIVNGDDSLTMWAYAVTNGNIDGKVFYRPDDVDVLCMVAEDAENKL